MAIIDVADLPSALQSTETIDLMVDGANARALRVAPCLGWEGAADSEEPAPSQSQLDEARLILLGSIKRWAEAGAGSIQQQSAGPFGMSVDTRQRTGYNLWPSEIEGLQDICQAAGSGGTGRAFEVDTMPADAGVYGVDYWWSSPTDRAAF